MSATSTVKGVSVSSGGDTAVGDVLAALRIRVDDLERKYDVAVAEREKSHDIVVRTLKQLACGGIAGAAARTTVAPLDRVKILKQTQFISSGGGADKYIGIWQSFRTIVKEEGVYRLWRGNVTNVVRVVPYAATQFASYDFFKGAIQQWSMNTTPTLMVKTSASPIVTITSPQSGASMSSTPAPLNTVERLICGAMAGMTATTVTHPLDVIRLRLNVDRTLNGAWDATSQLLREGGGRALFKGYVPTLLSLSPFIAINFAAFDTLKSMVLGPGAKRSTGNTLTILGLGAAAGLFSQTVCYPLDTVRRRMQMKGVVYRGTVDAFTTIARTEGLRGFYKGMVPNAVKVVPNNAIRFLVYEMLKSYMGITGGGGDGGGGG